MARKLADLSSDSSLSPPLDPLNTPAVAPKLGTNDNAKKRKAEATARVTKRTRKMTMIEGVDEEASDSASVEKPKKRIRKTKAKETIAVDEAQMEEGENKTIVKAKRKASSKKQENQGPLEERTIGSKLCVGAHISIAGGIHNSIPNLLHIGANAFALFLKNQRTWKNPDLNPEHAALFLDGCKHHNINATDCCVPHGSYLVNLAHPDEDRKNQAYASFHDDLTRCHKLAIKYYNFHPGNANSTTREGGIKLIAEAINKAHQDPMTGEVVPLLETMASLGNTIGGTFEDIADIINLVDQKDRVGVCLDTCHVFAAGYDLRTPEAYAETMEKFDNIIGLEYLKALHVNDSKAPFGSHRDLHARLGTGYLGLRSFHNIVNDERLHGLPMILETPIDVIGDDGKKYDDKGIWAREIKMLEQLVGMDADSEQFKTWELELFQSGTSERERIGDQVKRKIQKDTSPKKRRGKRILSEDEDKDE